MPSSSAACCNKQFAAQCWVIIEKLAGRQHVLILYYIVCIIVCIFFVYRYFQRAKDPGPLWPILPVHLTRPDRIGNSPSLADSAVYARGGGRRRGRAAPGPYMRPPPPPPLPPPKSLPHLSSYITSLRVFFWVRIIALLWKNRKKSVT
jgi:hypothetical protein